MFNFFKNKKKLITISLDGVPYTFLNKMFKENKLSNLKKFTENNNFIRMNSVLPPVSSVAWASFLTGKDPSGHGLYGFMDRIPNPYKTFIPMGKNIKCKILPETLSDMKKKVIMLNVPSTTPPRSVNGILVSGFLGMTLERAAFPKSIIPELKSNGYIVDASAALARKDKNKFIKDELKKVLEGRIKTSLHLLENKKWDFFMCHIMETDRLSHFYWKEFENQGEYYDDFIGIFEIIDDFLGKIIDKYSADKNTKLLFLSDHGFCPIKKEVNLNAFLKQQKILKFNTESPEDFSEMSNETKAYSLIPGRFYINIKDREQMGSVEKHDIDKVLDELINLLKELKVPDGDIPVIDKFYKKNEIYSDVYKDDAPDLVVLPHNGYDLKQSIKSDEIFTVTPLEGMHTYDDAFFTSNMESEKIDAITSIIDVNKIITDYFK